MGGSAETQGGEECFILFQSLKGKEKGLRKAATPKDHLHYRV